MLLMSSSVGILPILDGDARVCRILRLGGVIGAAILSSGLADSDAPEESNDSNSGTFSLAGTQLTFAEEIILMPVWQCLDILFKSPVLLLCAASVEKRILVLQSRACDLVGPRNAPRKAIGGVTLIEGMQTDEGCLFLRVLVGHIGWIQKVLFIQILMSA